MSAADLSMCWGCGSMVSSDKRSTGAVGVPGVEAPAQAPGQTLKATGRRCATPEVLPVAECVFRDPTETDGRIALHDDVVTPVFHRGRAGSPN